MKLSYRLGNKREVIKLPDQERNQEIRLMHELFGTLPTGVRMTIGELLPKPEDIETGGAEEGTKPEGVKTEGAKAEKLPVISPISPLEIVRSACHCDGDF